jgi:hypothetical protein
VNVKPVAQESLQNNGVVADTSVKRFVTFYVTNFPPHASNFFLRKGFEVCGILEDVFVARNRNMSGEVYGFVCYAKVRDVNKLLKVINSVWFGQYRVHAVLARFDRKGSKKVEVVRKGVGADERGKVEGRDGVEGVKVGRKEIEGEKRKDGEEPGKVRERKEEEGVGERGGKVLVKVRDAVGSKGEGGRHGRGEEEGLVGRKAGTVKQTLTSKMVHKYVSLEEDWNWAKRGLIGTVIDGESIPIIQSCVEDADFKDIDIIPLGADKVFIHSLSGAIVSEIVGAAKHFFDLIFSSLYVWDKAVLPFQRGAWLRLYGIPLQAWNENFFKLCVFDYGKYLRADTCSLNKERFDYARVLISTSSLDVLNVSEHILVDGVLVDIKIVEEWGFCLGDDACLYEEDDKCDSTVPEDGEINDELGTNAAILVNKLAKDVDDVDEFIQRVDIENNNSHLKDDVPIGALLSDVSSDGTKNVKENCALSKSMEDASINEFVVEDQHDDVSATIDNVGCAATLSGNGKEK